MKYMNQPKQVNARSTKLDPNTQSNYDLTGIMTNWNHTAKWDCNSRNGDMYYTTVKLDHASIRLEHKGYNFKWK